MPRETPWILRYQPPPEPQRRLFCFPFAGGTASIYRGWQPALSPDVELCAIQLPGRETRFAEPAFNNMAALLEAMFNDLLPWLDKPYALFGHSLGAIIAFELQQAVRDLGLNGPQHFFASGHRGPHIPDPDAPIHDLPAEAFLIALRTFSGTPEVILQNEEIMAIFGPILRADMQVDNDYLNARPQPLDCPLTVYGGQSDNIVSQAHLESWRRVAGPNFSIQSFEGDHFLLKTNQNSLLEHLKQRWPI